MRTVLVVLLLSGCSAQQLALKEVEKMERVYGPACEKLGYKPQTPEFSDCLIKLSDRRR